MRSDEKRVYISGLIVMLKIVPIISTQGIVRSDKNSICLPSNRIVKLVQ